MRSKTQKIPPGFKLISRSSAAFHRAVMSAGASGENIRHRRQFGNRSPLDRLPERVKRELRKRCKASEVFRVIRAWLLAKHQHSTSITALSDWWKRQQAESEKRAPGKPVRRSPLEFIIHAPGASEVRVFVKHV